jgi:uncharacterized delta-60 repeat protein
MTTKNIVFVDSRISHYASLIDSLAETAEVFVLDGESDGLTQMAAWLKGRSGIDAIHVISHGSLGALVLGSTVLDGANLAAYGSQLADIGSALTLTGDILLYGCNVAQGNMGLQLITSLAQASGADVAASVNATGAAALGGDGVLEQSSGSVEAASLLVNDLTGLLAVNVPSAFVAGGGRVTTDFVGGWDLGTSVILQTDGKILVAGIGSDGFALARYNANGSLDTSFDTDGKLTTDFFGSEDRGNSITLQTDGKILVAGYARNGNNNFDFALARYNANGSLDTSFDTDGKLTTDFFGHSDECNSITLQTDGKILLAGLAENSSGSIDFALARYNVNGSLDTSFDTDGKLTTDFFGNWDYGNSITLQTNGKILVAGFAINNSSISTSGLVDFALARYNANGSLDTSFDTDGKLTTDFFEWSDGAFEYGNSIALQTDSKILVAGYARNGSSNIEINDFALARYNANGSLDTSFDTDGKLVTDFFGHSDECNSITLQTDGKILVAGVAFSVDSNSSGDFSLSSGDFALARYNANGSLDTSFDTDGKLTTDFFGKKDEGNSITLQTDGKILVAGLATASNIDDRFALARYNANGSLDTSFGLFGAEAAVATLYRAFASTSPGNADFNSQVASAKAQIASGSDPDDMLSYSAYAKSFGSAYLDRTPFALASLLLTNMSILPSTNATVLDLEPALGYYIQQVGVENVGIIALQLASIISTFETKGGIFAVYNAPAVAWNKEVAAAYAYASNPANTSSLTDQVFYTLTADSPIMTEGNSGTKPLTFTLTLDQAPTSAVTVSYQTLTSGTATANVDFVAATSTVTFAVGQTKANVPITVNGDSVVEPNETVAVQFSGSSLKATVTATGIMTNDDIQYFVTAFSPTVDEGKSVSFVVSTSPPTPGLVVPYTLSGISAADLAGGALTGSVSLGSDGKATLLVALAADQFTEGAETLYATFQGASASVSVIDVSLTGQTDGGSDGSSGSGG